MFDYLALIAPSVFAFYMVVLTNFIPEIVGCRMQQLLRNNMLAKHILAMFLLFFLVILINPDTADKKLPYCILLTVGVYAWFILTTRSPFIISVITILILLVVYIVGIKKTRLDSENQKEQARKMQKIQFILLSVALLSSLVGCAIYFIEKRKEYGSSFTASTFLWGTKECRYYTPSNAKIIKTNFIDLPQVSVANVKN